MRYLVTGQEMKRYDNNTIENFGMEALVLMERAALCTVDEIEKRKHGLQHVLVVAGCGNNGGDGLAIGRLMALAGHTVTFVLMGSKEKCSRETKHQINILEKYGFPIQSKIEKREYDIVIDAIFGIGLTRDVSGDYEKIIESINEMKKTFAVSVDISSGIHAGSGAVLGRAVKADLTVTYGFAKRGHFLYPGADYTGELVIRDIGITPHSFEQDNPLLFTYNGIEDIQMPVRDQSGNKGTFGKVLIIAGQQYMAGACELAGRGCLRSGAGMVRILTHESNRIILQETLPEAMISIYDSDESEKTLECLRENLRTAMKWADCIVIGPGLGKTRQGEVLLHTVLKESNLPVVIDADGVNLLGSHEDLCGFLSDQPERKVVLTPHMGELAGLAGCTMTEVKETDFTVARETAEKLKCVLISKDARTYICEAGRKEAYLNTSGNSGMATAGSGDVLAGMIGGLLAQGMEAFAASCMGVHLHGLAGDYAAGEKSEYSVIATDIAEAIPVILQRAEERR